MRLNLLGGCIVVEIKRVVIVLRVIESDFIIEIVYDWGVAITKVANLWTLRLVPLLMSQSVLPCVDRLRLVDAIATFCCFKNGIALAYLSGLTVLEYCACIGELESLLLWSFVATRQLQVAQIVLLVPLTLPLGISSSQYWCCGSRFSCRLFHYYWN